MSPSLSPQKVFTLNDSTTIPAIGIGSYDDAQEESDTQTTAILNALKVGYRHIDTASFYATEAAIGAALKEAFGSGLVKREDLFITTKVAPNQIQVDNIIPSIKASISNLQVEYVDLYLIHWPISMKPGANFFSTNVDDYLPFDVKGTWEQMEKLVELGLTKSVGVSNFSIKVLKELLSVANIPPAVNQIETHPQWQQDKVRAYCKENNIQVSAWSPIGAPGVSNGLKGILDNPLLKGIAEKHGKTVPQVNLRWLHELGVVIIPKSFKEHRMKENFDIWDFSLTAEDHEKIKTVEQMSIASTYPQFNSSPWRTFADFWVNE